MKHTYDCWANRPGGVCWDHCSCQCHYPLWKVTVGGEVADNAVGNLFSDDLFFKVERNSPIVFYAKMSASDAIALAQEPYFEVARAREDWSI